MEFEAPAASIDLIVIMTKRSRDPKVPSHKRPARAGRWLLADAKARFCELVRCAKSEGAQIVTVDGRDEVVVVEAAEFRRLNGEPTGRSLCARPPSPTRGEGVVSRDHTPQHVTTLV
jgi:prevent-host-death family protein